MNYYQFHVGDYRRDTGHLSLLEHGVYRQLLDQYYMTEQPIQCDDAKALRTLCIRTEEEKIALENVLADFFVKTEQGYIHKRCDIEIAEFHQKSEAARNAANVRWAQARAIVNANALQSNSERMVTSMQTHSESNADAMQTVCADDANHKPLTTNHKPLTNSVPKGTADKSALTPSEIIFGYGLPLLTNAGVSDKQARSFLGGLRKAHGDDAVVNALRDCLKQKPLQPLEWLGAVLPPAGRKTANKQESLENRNRAVAAAWATGAI